jgi:hypothetical protein
MGIFPKMGLSQFAILIYDAILNELKKSMICLYLKALPNVEQLFAKILIFENFWAQTSFYSQLQSSWFFFSKIPSDLSSDPTNQ